MDNRILLLALLSVFLLSAGALAFDVAECEDDVDVDGDNDDDAWEDAKHGSFDDVDYYACYDDDNLYFLIVIDDDTPTDDDLVQIWIDPDDSGGSKVQSSDFGFEVTREEDAVEYQGTKKKNPSDWDVAVEDNDDNWVAEFAIELGKLDISLGDTQKMAFAIFVDDENGTSSVGPGSADEDEPDSWASLRPYKGSWGHVSAATLSGGTVTPVGVENGKPGNYKFEVTYRQPQGEAPQEVKVYINSQSYSLTKDVSNCNVANGCKYSYTKKLEVGSYIFYFTARFGGGTVQFPINQNLQFDIRQDNRKPSVEILRPSEGASVKGSLTISGKASDPDGAEDLSSVQVRIDSGNWIPITGTATWDYTLDTTGLADGAHVIQARASDRKDAFSDPDSVTISVNNRPPVTESTDTDDDGMPNFWELAYGLDPENANDASKDKDGDGLTNLQEYIAGKNPAKADNKPETTTQSKPAIDNMMIWMLIVVVIIALVAVIIAYMVGKGGSRQPQERPRGPPTRSRPPEEPSDEIPIA